MPSYIPKAIVLPGPTFLQGSLLHKQFYLGHLWPGTQLEEWTCSQVKTSKPIQCCSVFFKKIYIHYSVLGHHPTMLWVSHLKLIKLGYPGYPGYPHCPDSWYWKSLKMHSALGRTSPEFCFRMDMDGADGGSCASISTTFPLLFPILVTCQVLQKRNLSGCFPKMHVSHTSWRNLKGRWLQTQLTAVDKTWDLSMIPNYIASKYQIQICINHYLVHLVVIWS